jgi:hypothetical protein
VTFKGNFFLAFPSFSLPFSHLVTFKGNFFLAFPSFSLPFSHLVTFKGNFFLAFPSFSLPFGWLVTFKGNFFLAFPSFSLPFSRLVTFQPHNETRTLRSFGAHRRDSRHIFCKIFQVFRASTTPENFAECVSRCLHAKMSFCSGLSAFAKGRIYLVVFLRGTTFFP